MHMLCAFDVTGTYMPKFVLNEFSGPSSRKQGCGTNLSNTLQMLVEFSKVSFLHDYSIDPCALKYGVQSYPKLRNFNYF